MARIINSPGVQITEKDLSLRTELPAGTQVFVPGFAPQGPTAEPIMITTISEMEAVFGTPTTAAERYFYYSCKEILNSPAVLNCIRLPYGADAGVNFASAYSLLLYPVAAGTDVWTISKPITKEISREEFLMLSRGDFEWVDTEDAGVAAYLFTPATGTDPASIEIKAGFFIVNDLQSVINETGEGYYIGIADNSSVDQDVSPDFDSLKFMYSLQGAGEFVKLTQEEVAARLDFSLSATRVQADSGVASVSEELEQIGFASFATQEYQDHVSVGVFKIRRSVADPTKLTIASAEKFVGSFNANRKVVNPNGGTLVPAFIEDIVNDGSSSIKMYVNPAISQDYVWSVGSTLPTTRVEVDVTDDSESDDPDAGGETACNALFPVGIYRADTADVSTTKIIGEVPLKLEKCLRTIENTENTTVDVLVDAGLSTIYSIVKQQDPSAEENFNDAFKHSLDDTNDDWQTIANILVNFAQNTRKDCISIIDPPRGVFLQGKNSKIIDDDTKNFTQHIYTPLKTYVDTIESNYAVVYANWVKVPDVYSGKSFWLPFSGYAAAVIGRSDAASETWIAPAGLNRGNVGNILDIAFNPNQKQRDRLYEIATNPVVFFNGDGYAVYGQKTLQNKPTAFDRINVRRLFLTLERATLRTMKYFVFEPNTAFTRKRVKDTIEPIFEACKRRSGVYDYLIVCDDRNNPPDTIDNNELVVDIYLKPVRAAEFILVNFIATRTSQNFQELI